MASGKLTADGSTPWVTVQSKEGGKCNMMFAGTWGGGTITLKKQINGVESDLLDNQASISFTANDDSMYNLAPGTKVRATLASSTSPSLDWIITGF